jgi:hypothetical protein
MALKQLNDNEIMTRDKWINEPLSEHIIFMASDPKKDKLVRLNRDLSGVQIGLENFIVLGTNGGKFFVYYPSEEDKNATDWCILHSELTPGKKDVDNNLDNDTTAPTNEEIDDIKDFCIKSLIGSTDSNTVEEAREKFNNMSDIEKIKLVGKITQERQEQEGDEHVK